MGHAHGGYRAPEPFLRKLRERKLKDVLVKIVPVLAVLATVILAVCFFFRAFRQGSLSWPLPFRVGMFVLALRAIEKINTLPLFYRSYDTSQALSTFTITSLIGLILGVVFYGLMTVVVVSLAMALLRRLYPAEMRLQRWLGCVRFREGSTRLWAHSLLLGATLFLVARGSGQLGLFARYHWMGEYLRPGSYSPPGLNTYLAFLIGPSSIGSALLGLFVVVAIVLIWLRVLPRSRLILLPIAVLAVLFMSAAPAESIVHFLTLAGISLLGMGAFLFTVIRLVRFNLLAYGIMIWFTSLIPPGIQMLSVSEGLSSYQIQGALLVFLGLFPLLLPIIANTRTLGASQDADGQQELGRGTVPEV